MAHTPPLRDMKRGHAPAARARGRVHHVRQQVTVTCHTRELAHQFKLEFDLFTKHFQDLNTIVAFSGVPIAKDKKMLKEVKLQVLIGT